jgi:hypothetical protein
MKPGTLTIEKFESLRRQLTDSEHRASISPAGPGVLFRDQFWQSAKAKLGKPVENGPLDLFYFSVTQYAPEKPNSLQRLFDAGVNAVPDRAQRFLPESWLRWSAPFIQNRPFHKHQGSDYAKGDEAIRNVLQELKEWAIGYFGKSHFSIGNFVDNAYVAGERSSQTEAEMAESLAMSVEKIKRKLNASESTTENDPHLLVFHVRSEDLPSLAGGSAPGALDMISHAAELLEVHAREAAGFLGKELSLNELAVQLDSAFDVVRVPGDKALLLSYNPQKKGFLMKAYRESQRADSVRGEASLFSRAPADLGSALFRAYHGGLEKLGVAEHRARLWLGSRYVQGFVVPFIELIGLPGFAWVLAPYVGFALAVVVGSVVFSWIHGSSLPSRGPPSGLTGIVGRQSSQQFLVRLLGALAINAISLFVGTEHLSEKSACAKPSAPDSLRSRICTSSKTTVTLH